MTKPSLCDMILRLEKERKVSSPFYFSFFKLISGCGGTADALVSGSSEEIRVGSNPVIRTKQRGRALVVRPLCFIRVVGFEIGRKLHSNLSVGPNSPVDCLSAKAATGGNPVIRTRKRLRIGYNSESFSTKFALAGK